MTWNFALQLPSSDTSRQVPTEKDTLEAASPAVDLTVPDEVPTGKDTPEAASPAVDLTQLMAWEDHAGAEEDGDDCGFSTAAVSMTASKRRQLA